MNFIRRLNRGNFFKLDFYNLGVNWRYVSHDKIMPARPKKHMDMGCEYKHSKLPLAVKFFSCYRLISNFVYMHLDFNLLFDAERYSV